MTRPTDPELGRAFNNLALEYVHQEKYVEAEEAYAKAQHVCTMIGMLAGLALTMVLGNAIPALHWPGMAWTWNVAVGSPVTFGLGFIASRAHRPPEQASG